MGATIESHLETYENEIASKFNYDIYVAMSLQEQILNIVSAVQLPHGEKTIFREASMNLRELVSNDSLVNQLIVKEDRASYASVKVLGHSWDIQSDSLSLKKPSLVNSLYSLFRTGSTQEDPS